MIAVSIQTIVEVTNGKLLSGQYKDEVISVTTNSKEIQLGGLFVPIRGERVDGHRFINGALENGIATFTEELIEEERRLPGKNYILVKDCLQALQALAAYYRSLFPMIPIIGVTGSVGKTTTKEMIAAALEGEKNVLKTKGNMNSQIGLSLMMFELDFSYDIAIIEMGISEKGEMERLALIAQPETAVVTNVGVSHIGQLGSREGIREEKLDIIKYFTPSVTSRNTLYVYGDNDLLQPIANGQWEQVAASEKVKEILPKIKVVSYGEQGNKIEATNIINQDSGMSFIYHDERSDWPVSLSVIGKHLVYNALVAIALAKQYGVSKKAALEGLENYQTMAMRGAVVSIHNVDFIDDTYNASPMASLRSFCT